MQHGNWIRLRRKERFKVSQKFISTFRAIYIVYEGIFRKKYRNNMLTMKITWTKFSKRFRFSCAKSKDRLKGSISSFSGGSMKMLKLFEKGTFEFNGICRGNATLKSEGREVKQIIRGVVDLLICLRMTHHGKQLGHHYCGPHWIN